MPLTLIAALSRNRCIGKDGDLPWDLPEDRRHFRALTAGKSVVMGRKTWESLPDSFRPLPKRTNVVLTRQADYVLPDGVERYASLLEAIAAHQHEDLFVIGGGGVYAEALPLADRLELTHVDQDIDGDVFFPDIGNAWRETARTDYPGYSFVTYERK